MAESSIFLIDKPLEWTSFDVVNKMRGILRRLTGRKKIKVGHAGTLDPLATGVLIICVGKMTKSIESIMSDHKTYIGSITFGQTTPSYDLESEPEGDFPIDHLNEENLKEAAAEMEGEQLQTPPVFSAKKIDGKRAYDYARKGQDVKMRQNLINIHQFAIKSIALPKVNFEIQCTKGTYIRTIADDYGKRLSSGAHLSGLRRTASGSFRIEDALSVDLWTERIKALEGTSQGIENVE